MPASITIDDTHPLFPRVLALLAGSVASPGGQDAVTPQSAPAALPPAPSPPAATADLVVERVPAARSVTRPATVGPRKASGGATLLPFAEPAATPPDTQPTTGKESPAGARRDAQRGTVGAELHATVQSGTANGTPSPEAASAASTIVARVVAALSGSVERVEPSPPRRPTRAPSSKPATGASDPGFTPELLETAGF